MRADADNYTWRQKSEGIEIQLTAPYSPQQNGKAERKNRYLVEMARCMLIESGLPNKYWGEAIVTANYLQNRLPTRTRERTPYEYWNSQKPDLKNIHVFGCDAYVHIPDERRRKLDKKAKKLCFVGYSEESKAFRLLQKDNNKITISRDVTFMDNVERQEEQQELSSENDSESEVDIELRRTTDENTQVNEAPRRSERTNIGVPPCRYGEHAGIVVNNVNEPNTIEEALSGPNKCEWKKATDEEYLSIIANKTWELTELPAGQKEIGCKWIFKLKRDEKGNIIRFKTRLVALGYNQKYGIDYDEIFAPVVKQTTLRLLLTIASRNKFTVKHYDVKNAFLNGELSEEIYMSQPPGYEVGKNRKLVVRLRKSIYGLKQSAKNWNKRITKELENLEYKQGKADPCLYTKQNNNGSRNYIIIYVDDILIASKDFKEITKLEQRLSECFQITNLGNVKEYAGVQVERDKNGNYYIHQSKHINGILQAYQLVDAKASDIPLDVGYKDMQNGTPLPDNTEYQSLIGSLMYIAISTRPDIAASVAILSRKMQNPTEIDWTEAKRIIRYLKGTINYVLDLGDTNKHKEGIVGYADADWGEDRTDRKSNSWYIFQYYGNSITWASRKQSCVALSSAEAEYISLSEACQDGLCIIQLLQEFRENVQLPLTMYEDNQSCIKMVENNKISKRTKHVDIRYHNVKDLKEGNLITLTYCETNSMIADLLTKPLRSTRLKTLAEYCGLMSFKKDSDVEEECRQSRTPYDNGATLRNNVTEKEDCNESVVFRPSHE